jgi:putative ABC transport system permease protein
MAMNTYIAFTCQVAWGLATRLLTFCFRNLFRRKVRTALCVLGVTLATAFVITIGVTTMRYTTVIKEMNVLFNGQVMVASKDAIVIQAIPIGGSMLPQSYTEERLLGIAGVEKTVPVLFVTPVGASGISQLVPVNFSIGIRVEDWKALLGPTPLKGNVGHLPSNESGNEIVAGISIADQYSWTVGSELKINGYSLNVSGILDTKLAILARSIIMPLELAQNIYNYKKSVNIITVKPAKGYSQQNLAQAIEQNVTYVNALTEEERNDIIQPVLAQIEAWSLDIQSVIVLMSLILVMTVTIMSVSERRRDFATLDAIGAPMSYVFRAVLVEASLIGVFGGVLGIVLGSVFALALASFYTSIPISQFFPGAFDIVPPLYMVEILVAVIGVCCIGGIIPAVNAARMRIAEVLRAEY